VILEGTTLIKARPEAVFRFFMGPLAQRAQRKELAAVLEHMRVEGENIKRIIEAQAHETRSLGHQEKTKVKQ
jgi:hypothetical protein